MNAKYNSTPASWVASYTLANGSTLDISSKGAVAINGNKFRPVFWLELLAVCSDEVRAVLSRPELGEILVSKADKQAKFEAEKTAYYAGLGLDMDRVKLLVSVDIKAAKAARLF